MSKTSKRRASEGASGIGLGPANPHERGQRRFLEDSEEDGELDLALAFISGLDSATASTGGRATAESYRSWYREAFRAGKLATRAAVPMSVDDGDMDVDSEAPTVAMTGSAPKSAPKAHKNGRSPSKKKR